MSRQSAVVLSTMTEFGQGERGAIHEDELERRYFIIAGFEDAFARNGMDIRTQDLDALANANDFQLETNIIEHSASATRRLVFLEMIANADNGIPAAGAVSDDEEDEDEENVEGNVAGAA